MSIIIPQQDAVEVFVNSIGTITIQQSSFGRADDALIEIHPQHIPILNRALREAKRLAEESAINNG